MFLKRSLHGSVLDERLVFCNLVGVLPSAARRTRTILAGFLRSCSHNRSTVHPSLRSVLVVSRSRIMFLFIFANQYSRLLSGWRRCLGHPCQKQPSTKTTTFSRLKTKSGLPGNFS